jgi:hypothetical protein
MIRLLFPFIVVLFFQLPQVAGAESFRHKHKPQKVRNIKDPVSKKHHTLPKQYQLKPTQREILGQKH